VPDWSKGLREDIGDEAENTQPTYDPFAQVASDRRFLDDGILIFINIGLDIAHATAIVPFFIRRGMTPRIGTLASQVHSLPGWLRVG
jgi:hypothetical protein